MSQSSEKLFQQAYSALIDETTNKLRPVKMVTFNCLHPTSSTHNYDVILYVDEAFRVVQDLKYFAAYGHLGIPSITVESGYMKSVKIEAFPLVTGFSRQFELEGYMVTIMVTAVLIQ